VQALPDIQMVVLALAACGGYGKHLYTG